MPESLITAYFAIVLLFIIVVPVGLDIVNLRRLIISSLFPYFTVELFWLISSLASRTSIFRFLPAVTYNLCSISALSDRFSFLSRPLHWLSLDSIVFLTLNELIKVSKHDLVVSLGFKEHLSILGVEMFKERKDLP